MSEDRDNFDLEVSSLTPPPTPSDADVDTAAPAPEDGSASATSPQAIRHVSLAASRTRTRQLVRAGGVATFLILLISAVLLAPGGNRDAVLRLLTPPTPVPSATPRTGADA